MSIPIAIITPCYNQALFLEEAVASVIAQSYPYWELIIIDDGSSDNTAQVSAHLIDTYANHNIRLLRQQNEGLPASRNNGIALTSCEYIFPLDADDKIEPTMLAQTVAILDHRPEVGFVYTDTHLFGSEDSLLHNRAFDRELLRIDCYLHAATLFRRKAWEQVGGYSTAFTRGMEDWDFWLRLVEAGWSGAHIPLPLLHYRRSETSKLSKGRQLDLELRAQIILSHAALYERPFQRWAKRTLSAHWSPKGVLRSPAHWLMAHASYCTLIARYAPQELSRLALRPLFWHLPLSLQTGVRHLGRKLIASKTWFK